MNPCYWILMKSNQITSLMLEVILLNTLVCVHQEIQTYCNPYIFSLKSSAPIMVLLDAI